MVSRWQLVLAVGALAAVTNSRHFESERVLETPFKPSRRGLQGFGRGLCGFETFFDQNTKGEGIHKWRHYFDAYEQEFGRHCGADAKPVKMIEIGVQSGGSMRMWRSCFGDALDVHVGIDINSNTKAWERFGDEPGSKPGNVHVEIGSQADPAVFARIDTTYPGGFDIVLDDGSHFAEHMVASFRAGWKLLRPGGVYFIEDITKENVQALHEIILASTHPYEDTVRVKGHSIIAAMYDNPGRPCCEIPPNAVQREVEYVKMYPMLLAIKKRERPLSTLHADKRGSTWIPYFDKLGRARKRNPGNATRRH